MADEMDVDDIYSAPQGTKRKASEDIAPPPVNAPRRIQALAEDVVNKIAAGEIILTPGHALKELIENAVDAGATSLEILAKEGGLKLLQISDNGHGIEREDLPILCERFTTSKLKTFEDLTSIGTYGFRGEALASISHIAHLSVTTKTKESSCAWRAHYADGKLVPQKPGQSADPKPTAGRQGTQITVEDLFYNVPTRRRAFRSASEEYARILDLVGRYAVHCSGVSFTCKKHGESSMGISVPAAANIVDRIRQVHGSAVANELLHIKANSDRWGFKAEAWASNANYSVKKTSLLLFINHRSVESSAIKKAVEQTYSSFLPKGGHPFIYISLEIDPHRVDVNVHPTKKEVNFLNEDEIIEMLCDEIRSSLGSVDTSRTFMTQTLLPGAKVPTAPVTVTPIKATGNASPSRNSEEPSASRRTPQTSQKPWENNLVRTDSRIRKITAMLPPGQHSEAQSTAGAARDELEYEISDKEHTLCKLTSVRELRTEVRDAMHNDLTDVFGSHTFVGIVDERRRIAAIQGGVKLFLVDYGMLSNEFFYQVGLTDFGNFGRIQLDPPLCLKDLLTVAAEHEQSNAADVDDEDEIDWEEAVNAVHEQLIARRDMLGEYFSLDISPAGDVCSIPLLLKGYVPCMAKLPQFLLRLGPHVNWVEEKDCFCSFLRELASFYVPESLPPPSPPSPPPAAGAAGEEDGEVAARRRHLERVVESVLFPAFRSRLVATRGLLKGIVEVANLKGLYRVFERC
ncbi:histidine kinase-like ATPase [Phyllosticta citrichinensis]|uniref:Histidine kinase-like ATPase n=1 Tax=Phyllosticta citrichinensis TaxID=1130410 RepID=A0ABR1XNY6_9PEZI